MSIFSNEQITESIQMRSSAPLVRFSVPACRIFRLAVALMLAWAWLTPAIAAPVLRCQIDQGGTTRVLEFSPTSDPYSVRAVDINGRFRFKAVVVGDALHIDYIKLYAYSQNRRQPVLLHVAKYMAPVAAPETSQASFAALTGHQYLYSPQREREMQYGCALIEVAP
jgi:hypothetical protein